MPGPPPKDPTTRARRNRDALPVTILVPPTRPAPQPSLPRGVKWSSATRAWWKRWSVSPQAATFTTTDWDFLLDTALLHNAVWDKGELKHLPELRLRVSKFGATTEDRARLRMIFAAPASPVPPPRASARERYGDLRVVGPDTDTANKAPPRRRRASRPNTARPPDQSPA